MNQGLNAATIDESATNAAERVCDCEYCGKPVVSHGRRGPDRRYCNDTCRSLASYHRRHPLSLRVCPSCGKEFMPFREDQRYCNRRCRYRFNRQTRSTRNHPRSPWTAGETNRKPSLSVRTPAGWTEVSRRLLVVASAAYRMVRYVASRLSQPLLGRRQ